MLKRVGRLKYIFLNYCVFATSILKLIFCSMTSGYAVLEARM